MSPDLIHVSYETKQSFPVKAKRQEPKNRQDNKVGTANVKIGTKCQARMKGSMKERAKIRFSVKYRLVSAPEGAQKSGFADWKLRLQTEVRQCWVKRRNTREVPR
jgi:hypothetical protein